MLNAQIKKYDKPVAIADAAPNLTPHETETYRFGEEDMRVKEVHLQITHIAFEDEGGPTWHVEKFGMIQWGDVECTITHQRKQYEQEDIKSIDLVILAVQNPRTFDDEEMIELIETDSIYDPHPYVFLYTHKVHSLEEAEELLRRMEWLY